MRELKLISLDEYKEYQELKKRQMNDNMHINGEKRSIETKEPLSDPRIQTLEDLNQNSLSQASSHSNLDVSFDNSNQQIGNVNQSMPPPGKPVVKRIKKRYIEDLERSHKQYNKNHGNEWIKKWRKRF